MILCNGDNEVFYVLLVSVFGQQSKEWIQRSGNQ